MWYFKERRIPPLLPPHPSSLPAREIVCTARQHIVVCFDVKRIQLIIFLFHFRKLHEVRDRLDQLKDLAQYYQGGSEFDCATDGATYVMEQLARRADGDKRENRRWVCAGELLIIGVHVRLKT